MIKLIEDMPPGTVGIEAVGKVTGNDYRDVLVPAISDGLARKDVRLLYLLGPQFKAYTASGVWADTKLWARNMRAWKKVAIVSEAGWLEKTVKTVARVMPGKVKVFEPDDLDDAKAWVIT